MLRGKRRGEDSGCSSPMNVSKSVSHGMFYVKKEAKNAPKIPTGFVI